VRCVGGRTSRLLLMSRYTIAWRFLPTVDVVVLVCSVFVDSSRALVEFVFKSAFRFRSHTYRKTRSSKLALSIHSKSSCVTKSESTATVYRLLLFFLFSLLWSFFSTSFHPNGSQIQLKGFARALWSSDGLCDIFRVVKLCQMLGAEAEAKSRMLKCELRDRDRNQD